MSERQYIGARYVPKFYQNSVDPTSSQWESNVTYEPLTWVSLANGNMYISKKTVPASVGNPASTPEYWLEAGQFNAYIRQLQEEIDNMKDGTISGSLQNQISNNSNRITTLEGAVSNIPVNRKFVLIGDSFGVGIQGGGLQWADGWVYHFANNFPNQSFYYDPQGDAQFEGAAGFTTNNNVDFIHQLDYVYSNKLGDTSRYEITDIVVLGGTNDISANETQITAAIGDFCARARLRFPNAEIRIGIVGLAIRAMVNDSSVYKGYKKGAISNGASFLRDCMILGANPTYDSLHGHWNTAGYSLYSPYIEEMILTGRCKYHYQYQYSLDMTNEVYLPQYSFVYRLLVDADQDGVTLSIQDGDRHTPVILGTMHKMTDSDRTCKMFSVSTVGNFYFPFDLNDTAIIGTADVYYNSGDSNYINASKGVLTMIKESNIMRVVCTCGYPNFFLASIIGNNDYKSYIAINTNGNKLAMLSNDV